MEEIRPQVLQLSFGSIALRVLSMFWRIAGRPLGRSHGSKRLPSELHMNSEGGARATLAPP